MTFEHERRVQKSFFRFQEGGVPYTVSYNATRNLKPVVVVVVVGLQQRCRLDGWPFFER